MGNLGLLADEFDRQVVLREQDLDPAVVARSRTRVRELLGRAQEGTERVRRIVRDLGRFARSDGAGDGIIDVHALLDSTLEIADVQIRHRARLVRDYRAHRRVRGNEGRLGQVFLNLLVNAGQAITPGNPLEHEVRIATRELDVDRIEIAISDTGHGIPAKIRGRIFDPFFTTKPVGEGTGIGLAISHSIVSAVGGTLSVESEEGQGTIFRVVLPAVEAEEHSQLNRLPPVEEPAQPAPKPLRKARVLVVDDEPLIREMVCDALGEHQVEAVASGREALVHIVASDWDLILCDLIMPELSGMDLWERLAELKPQARDKLVFMTGGDFSGKASEFVSRVRIRRLEKPFSIKLLRQLVRRSVAR
jgi:CheY-like chemotaxis protein